MYLQCVGLFKLQVDHKKGFGGKFGVESDRVDRTAAGYAESGGQPVGTNYQRTRPEPSSQVTFCYFHTLTHTCTTVYRPFIQDLAFSALTQLVGRQEGHPV